nr:hypothetical protein [Tanacetum cinerariifolium]
MYKAWERVMSSRYLDILGQCRRDVAHRATLVNITDGNSLSVPKLYTPSWIDQARWDNKIDMFKSCCTLVLHALVSTGQQQLTTARHKVSSAGINPRVDLEGIGGNGQDQVKLPHDSPLSGGHISDRAEGSLNLEELFALCTNLSNRVLALETVNDAQAKEILTLKARIKKLEKRCKPSISHHIAWLKSMAKLSKMKKLGQMEFVSKQGKKSAKPRPKLDDSARLDADGVEYMETKEAMNEGRTSNKTEELNLDVDTNVIVEDKGSGKKGESIISTARPKIISTARLKSVSTADVTISSADPEASIVEPKTPPTTTSIFNDEDITMAQTLIKMKEKKTKEKGVAFKEVEESDRPTRSVLTLKLLPTIDPKDKGKAILEEPGPKKMTRSDFDDVQVARDEEIARQLEAKLHEEDKYTVDERATLLAEYFKRRKKQLAEERAAVIRNKPPTRTQLRRLMMTYLKHTGIFTHSQLNKRTFKEIQALYIKEKEKVANFVPVGSDEDERLIQRKNEKAADVHKEKVLKGPNSTKVLKMEGRKKEGKQTHADDESNDKGMDGSNKRKECLRMKIMSKRQKTDAEIKEEEHLKTFLKITSDEEVVDGNGYHQKDKIKAKPNKTEHEMDSVETQNSTKSQPSQSQGQRQSRGQRIVKWAKPYPSNRPGQPT